MSNEYKFRGKPLNRGIAWFFGDLRHGENGEAWIFPLDEWPGVDKHRVDPKTTGICATIDGVEYAAGDIVETDDGRLYEVEFHHGALMFDCEVLSFYLLEHHAPVVGNKWDNPELLAKLKEQEAAE